MDKNEISYNQRLRDQVEAEFDAMPTVKLSDKDTDEIIREEFDNLEADILREEMARELDRPVDTITDEQLVEYLSK